MEKEAREDFLKLFLRHERAVFAYIHSMIPSRADAEDVLQEVSVTLFEKFDDFEPGTDFRAWAFRVAYFKVMQARQRYARSKLVFDDDIVAAVAAAAEELGGDHDQRHAALEGCLKKLNERDRRMVLARYERGSNVGRAAAMAGRSMHAAYKALARIKVVLRDCVEAEMVRLKAAGGDEG